MKEIKAANTEIGWKLLEMKKMQNTTLFLLLFIVGTSQASS